MASSRRRETLGIHSSAALPALWRELDRRGWKDSDFARAARLTSGGASKVVYGDVEPGRRVALFCFRELGISFELWDRPCPAKRRPHSRRIEAA